MICVFDTGIFYGDCCVHSPRDQTQQTNCVLPKIDYVYDINNPEDMYVLYDAPKKFMKYYANGVKLMSDSQARGTRISKSILDKFTVGTYPIQYLEGDIYVDTGATLTVIDSSNQSPSADSASKQFDGDNPASVDFTVDFGTGSLAVTCIKSVSPAGTITDKVVTIPQDYLEGLKNGTYPFTVTFDNDTALEVSVEVINSHYVDPVDPSITATDLAFDFNNPQDIEIPFNLGAGNKAATGVSKVTAGGKEIIFTVEDSKIKIPADSFDGLKNGNLELKIEFDNGFIVSGESITVTNAPKDAPTIEQGTKTFDAENPSDISFTVSAQDTTIVGVELNGESVTYAEEVTIPPAAFSTLKNGTYPVTVEFSDGTIASGLFIKVINVKTDKPDVSDKPDKPVVNVKDFPYEHYKDTGNDIKVPVNSDNPKVIGIPEDKYAVSEGVLTIDKSYLETLEPGEHDITVDGKKIPIVVYETAEDRTGPFLLYDYIPFHDEDVVLYWTQGSDGNVAEDVLALQIDKDLILPSGDRIAYSKKAVQNLIDAYEDEEDFEIATPNNVVTGNNVKRRSSRSLIKNAVKALYSNAVYKVGSDTITWSGDYISGLKLAHGVHQVGAVFNNTDSEDNLSRVLLVSKESKPEQPTEPSEPEQPAEPVEPSKPSKPSYSGSSSSSSGGSSYVRVKPGYHEDGSWNSKYKIPVSSATGYLGTDGVWKTTNGNVLPNTWVWSGSDWYMTDMNGCTRRGWYEDVDGKWYYFAYDTGAMLTGWYFEHQDGRWYFLSPLKGDMLTGWQFVDSRYYYLTESVYQPSYTGDNILGWIYQPGKADHPYGSMWANETTPDNYKVDSSGAWVK